MTALAAKSALHSDDIGAPEGGDMVIGEGVFRRRDRAEVATVLDRVLGGWRPTSPPLGRSSVVPPGHVGVYPLSTRDSGVEERGEYCRSSDLRADHKYAPHNIGGR